MQRIALTNCLIECVAIKIHFSKKQMLTILAVYRPPGLSASSVSTFCSHLDGAIDECCSAATQPFCLVGNFTVSTHCGGVDRRLILLVRLYTQQQLTMT